jgi:hypothetical protein
VGQNSLVIFQQQVHKYVLDTSLKRNLVDQNKEVLVRIFYTQLIFQFLDVKAQYVDLLVRLLHHQVQEQDVVHRVQLGVEDLG